MVDCYRREALVLYNFGLSDQAIGLNLPILSFLATDFFICASVQFWWLSHSLNSHSKPTILGDALRIKRVKPSEYFQDTFKGANLLLSYKWKHSNLPVTFDLGFLPLSVTLNTEKNLVKASHMSGCTWVERNRYLIATHYLLAHSVLSTRMPGL